MSVVNKRFIGRLDAPKQSKGAGPAENRFLVALRDEAKAEAKAGRKTLLFARMAIRARREVAGDSEEEKRQAKAAKACGGTMASNYHKLWKAGRIEEVVGKGAMTYKELATLAPLVSDTLRVEERKLDRILTYYQRLTDGRYVTKRKEAVLTRLCQTVLDKNPPKRLSRVAQARSIVDTLSARQGRVVLHHMAQRLDPSSIVDIVDAIASSVTDTAAHDYSEGRSDDAVGWHDTWTATMRQLQAIDAAVQSKLGAYRHKAPIEAEAK